MDEFTYNIVSETISCSRGKNNPILQKKRNEITLYTQYDKNAATSSRNAIDARVFDPVIGTIAKSEFKKFLRVIFGLPNTLCPWRCSMNKKKKISDILFSIRVCIVIGNDGNLRDRIPKKEKLFCSFGRVVYADK